MQNRVTVSLAGGVADVRLSRPDKMNALDGAMFEALVATGRGLRSERGLRAVVLSGEGRAFCAGLDVSSFGAGGGGRSLLERSGPSPANFAQSAAWVWAELPVPVIAAVHGVAYGGGLQIALAADIRFVAPDARLSVMEIKWGLIPDMTGSQTLRRLVRLDVAKELTYTGRVISGTEAAALGLATHVSDTPREAALELAREIASKSPTAIRAGKQLLDASGLVDLETGLRLEESLQ
jgi:enoyl-CoA hydratase/carnithine racemase